MKLKRIALSFVLFLSLVTTAAARAKNTSDDYISDSVRQKLAADQVIKGGAA